MSVAYLHSGRYSLARAALEEAKRIDPAKREEADKLIAWIDRATIRSASVGAVPGGRLIFMLELSVTSEPRLDYWESNRM